MASSKTERINRAMLVVSTYIDKMVMYTVVYIVLINREIPTEFLKVSCVPT